MSLCSVSGFFGIPDELDERTNPHRKRKPQERAEPPNERRSRQRFSYNRSLAMLKFTEAHAGATGPDPGLHPFRAGSG